jgi:hypothetical protein
VGRVAAEARRELTTTGRPASVVAEVRHPAHGGAEEFRAQAGRLLGIELQSEA